jgi:hypothetical protein
MLAELIGVALLPFALYPRRYDDEGPPEESAAQARYKGRRNVLHAASVRIPTKSPGHSEMMSPRIPT